MSADNPLEPLVCVEYPGKVRDTAAMMATLGGANAIARACEEPNLRLELRFRPEDAFCKPTCGERTRETGFLLKVKKMRRKKGREKEGKDYKLKTEIVGTVGTTYKFGNLCDFQYLPVEKTEEGESSYRSIYGDVYFSKGLVDPSWLERKDGQDIPLFLPPAAFSRMDQPQDYHYRREASGEKGLSSSSSSSSSTAAATAQHRHHDIIGRTRQRRSHHAVFVTFDVDRTPDRPREIAVSQLKVKFIARHLQHKVRGCFDECPVWSKNALQSVTRIPPSQLKFVLPTLAYYFTTGPWRNQWVRFGYDPRKDRGAARFQTLDYRVRLTGGARHKVKCKRSYANYLLPYKAMNWSKPRTSVIDTGDFTSIIPSGSSPACAASRTAATPSSPSAGTSVVQDKTERLGKKAGEEEEGEEAGKDVYIFRPGRVPPCRQMFYQFKDLEVDEAQALLSESETGEGATCDEKNGWFLPGTDQKLREILTRSINRHLERENEGERGRQQEDGVAASENMEVLLREEEDDESASSETDDELP